MAVFSIRVKVTALCAIVATVLALSYAVAHLDVLKIERLRVQGPVDSLGLHEVTNIAQETINGNLLTVDIEALCKKISALSWVKSAVVTRVWPDTIAVSVRRHEAVAIYDDGRLVAEQGVLFTSNDEPIERLSRIPAFSGDPDRVAEAVRMLPLFTQEAAKVGARVKAVHVTYRGSWAVTLESNVFSSVHIELGRALYTSEPVRRLGQVLEQFFRVADMMQGYPEKIDARYRNAFAAQLPDKESHELWKKTRATATKHLAG